MNNEFNVTEKEVQEQLGAMVVQLMQASKVVKGLEAKIQELQAEINTLKGEKKDAAAE